MSYLESLRGDLEVIETFEQTLTRKLEGREDVVDTEDGGGLKKKTRRKTHTNLLKDDHIVNAGLSCVRDKAKDWLEKIDVARLEDELSEMRNEDTGGMSSFYKERRRITDYHNKNAESNDISQVLNMPTQVVVETLQEVVTKRMVFSGEECMGRYLDVHSFHTRYVNLFAKNDKRAELGYLEFLDRMGLFMSFDIAAVKTRPEYKTYLSDLLAYLKDFALRAQPLVDIDEAKAKAQFESQWMEGTIPGWKRVVKTNAAVQELSAEALEKKLGGDGLKQELVVRGLKCGGRPIDRALRLLKCTASHVIPRKQRIRRDFNPKLLALKEALVQYYVEHLGEFIDATKDRVTKKQTQTYEELEAELAAEEELGEIDLDDLSDDDAEDHILHNPLNLPLGWDGKPIPFWLYKLHGLGIEFKCEICGNYSYWGRRSFDRHFQEWRHAHGMRMLKIPNTKHFHDITKIPDALALYDKLRGQIELTQTAQEEFETSTGVKIDKKTYEDLKRQGLE